MSFEGCERPEEFVAGVGSVATNARSTVIGSSSSFSHSYLYLLATITLSTLLTNKIYASICQAQKNMFPITSTSIP